MAVWERETWSFVEGASGSVRLEVARGGPHHVARAVAVQDYPEGGARCLDIERFTRALYMRHVRRLVDPVEQGWKGMAMHWLDSRYGELRQGYRLLLSACDFLAVLESRACVPDFWQNVLVTWGMFDPPVPHVEEERSAQDVTPAHCADVLERDHARNSATLTRVSGERRERAAMVLERYLYGMQLSRAHVVPRTMREGCSSVTSTSWADTLDHPDAAPGEVRLASFRALCEPCLSGDDASRAARLPVRDGGGGHSGSCGGDGRRDGD